VNIKIHCKEEPRKIMARLAKASVRCGALDASSYRYHRCGTICSLEDYVDMEKISLEMVLRSI
jgi:hypothetical protein